MKKILSKLVQKKNFKMGAITGEYLSVVSTPTHVRLEQYKVFLNGVYVINYIYLSETILSCTCKTIMQDRITDKKDLQILAKLNKLFRLE